MKIFENLNFVLVETSHPGNIGACARAMNSMGIHNLCLVNPKDFPSKESEARAKSGKMVLDKAKIHENINRKRTYLSTFQPIPILYRHARRV